MQFLILLRHKASIEFCFYCTWIWLYSSLNGKGDFYALNKSLGSILNSITCLSMNHFQGTKIDIPSNSAIKQENTN